MKIDCLREKLAALAHEQWSGWMRYLFSKGTFNPDNSTWTMPMWAVKRWVRQMQTLYANLSENEKDNDRTEADRMIKIVINELIQRPIDLGRDGEILVLPIPDDFDLVELEAALAEVEACGASTAVRILEAVRREYTAQIGA